MKAFLLADNLAPGSKRNPLLYLCTYHYAFNNGWITTNLPFAKWADIFE